MTSVDFLKKEQLNNLELNPEYLIIKSDEGLNLIETLKKYTNFSYRGSDSSEFFIRNDIYDNYSQEKNERLKYYGLEAI